MRVVRGAGRHPITYGFGIANDVVVSEPSHTASGMTFTITLGPTVVSVELPLRGRHNALNCAGALAMAEAMGYDPSLAARGVATFGGVERRFREHGTHRGAVLIDDYAHLPAEIEAALSAARTHPALSGKVVAVFQPNRYHRVAAMAGEYAGCFGGADKVFITDIYASGTEPIDGVTGMLVVDAVRTRHGDVSWAATRDELVTAVDAVLAHGDICVSMGCGDIATFPADLGRTT
jgi:UDP-N-acetylmuramate--alanine ligase